MTFQALKAIFLAVAFAIPRKHIALGSNSTPNTAATSILARCPRSKCLTDAISCLAAGTKSDADGGNSGHAKRLANLEKEVTNLKAQLAKAGKPSGFAILNSNGRLPQNLLLAGYDKYSAYDLAWQSLHMAAAAACRGSTASGGSGPWGNSVRVRNVPDKKTCAQICLDTGRFRHCDAEVSIYGKKGKATNNGEEVGNFYNYGCKNTWGYGANEASVSNEAVMNYSGAYFSFCCCRK